jgi:hypothetical protein
MNSREALPAVAHDASQKQTAVIGEIERAVAG